MDEGESGGGGAGGGGRDTNRDFGCRHSISVL